MQKWFDPELMSNQPTTTRDISMFVPKGDIVWVMKDEKVSPVVHGGLSWSDIKDLIRGNGGPCLRKITLAEVWEHGTPSSHKECGWCKGQHHMVYAPPTPENHVCFFVKLIFQHTERSLTNVEVNEYYEKIRNSLSRAGVILR